MVTLRYAGLPLRQTSCQQFHLRTAHFIYQKLNAAPSTGNLNWNFLKNSKSNGRLCVSADNTSIISKPPLLHASRLAEPEKAQKLKTRLALLPWSSCISSPWCHGFLHCPHENNWLSARNTLHSKLMKTQPSKFRKLLCQNSPNMNKRHALKFMTSHCLPSVEFWKNVLTV